MTLDELLDCNADKLAAMSDAELDIHFSQYYTVTRPELAPKPKQMSNPAKFVDKQLQDKMAKLASLGIDLTSAMKKGYKR